MSEESKVAPQETSEKASDFVNRMREKVSPQHRFKKTDKLHLISRYPEYKEETKEDQENTQGKEVDLKKVILKRYDKEFLEKFKSFFSFLKNIFKQEEEKRED